MNRRHFLTVLGGTAAVSLSHTNNALAAPTTTPFYVKGLIMVSFEDRTMLRLGLPKARGHKATLTIAPPAGLPRSLGLKGTYTVSTAINGSGRQDYRIPELIRMQEIYGKDIHSRVNECPTVISIPYAAIKSISAAEVSPARYTFVRTDTGQEVTTFRPRKVAETLRIDLSSDAAFGLAGEKIAMNTLKELHAQYEPDAPPSQADLDAFTAHFPHYLAYLDRPATANFDVLPKRLGGGTSATLGGTNNFAPYWPYIPCYVVGI